MSITGVNRVLGQAVISDSFRQTFLSEQRAELLRSFQSELEPDELALLLGIETQDLREVGVIVEQYLRQRKLSQLAAVGAQEPAAAQPAATPPARDDEAVDSPAAGSSTFSPRPAWQPLAWSGVYLRQR